MLNMSEFELLTIQQGDRNFWLSVIVAIITFISVAIVYCDYRNRKNKERAEKSIEIAKEFAQNIVEPISILYIFFKKFDINKIIDKVNFIQLEDFDVEELNLIYDKQDIEEYRKIINTNDPNHEIRSVICDTLNNLEYMCMYISTEVADENCIYNSLHQQFLKTISLLYFEISLTNTDNKDKYYTNIIQVFNLWKNKYIKVAKKEEKFKEKQKKMKKKILPSTPKI